MFQSSFIISKYFNQYYFKNVIKFQQTANRLCSNLNSTEQQSFVDDKFTGYIPIKKLNISYCTSSGPGGQNVNRNNTKATVKLHLPTSEWIPEQVKDRITQLHRNSISKDGNWIIKSDKTRHQMLNLADCMDKLRCYIAEATKPPKIEPTFETLEIMRKKREKAAIKRLEEKRYKSLLKTQKRIDF